MSNTPLAGKRVLVTRPAHQANRQINQLHTLGAEPLPFPLLEISPFTPPSLEYHRAKSHILDLDLYQNVIFISANAARFGAELIDEYWPQLPIRVNWFAIGKKTAALLADYGIDAETAPLGYDSEALLKSPFLQQVSGERTLIIRGLGGREKLAEILKRRGAQVEYADVYQRLCPSYSNSTIKNMLYQHPLDALLITSGESLANLLTLATGSQDQFKTDTLLNSQLVVPSERIAQQARLAGFKRIKTATGPDDHSMIQVLLPATDAEINR